jgi:subtilisin-like proprotein convertase family protein
MDDSTLAHVVRMQPRLYVWSLCLPLALLAACADVTAPGDSDDTGRSDGTDEDVDNGDDRDTGAPDVRDIGQDDAAADVQGDSTNDADVVPDAGADATDAQQDAEVGDTGLDDVDDTLDDVGTDTADGGVDADSADVPGDSIESDAADAGDATDVAADTTADAIDDADSADTGADTTEPDTGLTCESGLPPGRWYPDADGDGYGDAAATPTVACDAPAGFVADDTDCDDTDSLLPAPGTLSVPFIGSVPVPPSGSAGTTTLIIPVDSEGLFSSMTVAVRVLHTDTGDLTLTLISPSGTRVVLARRRGFDDDFVGTVFSDSAASAISSGSNPFTGSWRPEQPLSTFLTEPVNGDWQLEIVDSFSVESGTLQAVTLNFELRCRGR